MIPKLRIQIDNTIKEMLPIEENKWRIYSKCKEDMQNYERKYRHYINPQEWREYIIYITDELQI